MRGITVALLLVGAALVHGFAPAGRLGLGRRTQAAAARGLVRTVSSPYGLSLRRTGRSRFSIATSLRAQQAPEDAVAALQAQIETGLIIGLPNASEAEVEELMAILTVTCRSLARKMNNNPGSVSSAGQTLLDSLGAKYVDEEALLSQEQWASVRASVQLPAEGPADPAQAVAAAEAGLSAKLEAFMSSRPGVDPADTKEVKAICLALSRSLARRAAAGKVSSSGLPATLEAEVRARLSDEGLISPSEWDAMNSAAAPAAAAAGPQGGGGEAPPIERASKFIDEMERLFPAVDKDTLQEAAKGQTQLEDAVYNVIEKTAANEDAARAATKTAAVSSPPAPAGAQTLTTPPVTTGACCFGLCVDIEAKGKPITINGIRTASSPGLNWGQGGAVKCQVYVTEGTSRGKELDPYPWTKIGETNEMTLPMVSWADLDPDYGSLPFSQPIRIEAGCTAGIVIHTNDLYGLVMSVGSGGGGDVDFWHEDENGELSDNMGQYEPGHVVAQDDFVAVKAGMSLGAALFEEFDNAMMPQPGGLSGTIEYTVG